VNKDNTEVYEKYLNSKVDTKWKNKHVYELYGIVNHMGSMSGGHYIAYV